MRLFIAIELPAQIRDLLERIQKELKSSGADVKWVDPKNIHLTLKFIGETQEKKLDIIMQIIEAAVKNTDSFDAQLSSLGAFPKISSPRVIWIGTGEGEESITRLAKNIEKTLEKIGILPEKRAFSAHITIGRTRSDLGLQKLSGFLVSVGKNIPFDNLRFNVNKVTLFKSTLTSRGPVYEPLKEIHLNAN